VSVINGDGQWDDFASGAARRQTWAISYPREGLPGEPLERVLWAAFAFHAHRDEMNAATHMSPPRYSPLTFRLADQLDAMNVYSGLDTVSVELLREVMRHRGQYAEDGGR
jgi:hypothetical protein